MEAHQVPHSDRRPESCDDMALKMEYLAGIQYLQLRYPDKKIVTPKVSDSVKDIEMYLEKLITQLAFEKNKDEKIIQQNTDFYSAFIRLYSMEVYDVNKTVSTLCHTWSTFGVKMDEKFLLKFFCHAFLSIGQEVKAKDVLAAIRSVEKLDREIDELVANKPAV